MHSRATILGLLACTFCLVSAAPAPPPSTFNPKPSLHGTTCSSSTSTHCSSSTSIPCSSSTSTPCSLSTSTPCSSPTSTHCAPSVWTPSSSSIGTPSSLSSTLSTRPVGAPSSSAVSTPSSAISTSSSAISTSSPSPLSSSQSVNPSSTVPVQPVQTSESTCGLGSPSSSVPASQITVNNTVTASGPTVTAPGTTVVSGTTVLCTVISGTTVYKSVTTPGPTVTAPGTTLTAPPVIHTATVISGTTVYKSVTTSGPTVTAPGTTLTAPPVIHTATVVSGTTETAPPTTVISGTTVFCTVVSGTTVYQPVTKTAPGTTVSAAPTTVTAAPTTIISGKTVYCTVVSGTTLFQPVTAPGTTWTAPGTTVTAPPACQPSCTDPSECNSCITDIEIEVQVEIEGDCDEDDEQCTSSSTDHNKSRFRTTEGPVVERKKPAQAPSGFKTVTQRDRINEPLNPTVEPVIAARNVPGTGTVVPTNVEGVCPSGSVKTCDGALSPDTNGDCHCLYNESDDCPDGAEKQCDVTGEICACAPHKVARSATSAEQSSKVKRSVPGGGHTLPIGKSESCPPNAAKICDVRGIDCSCLFEADGCPDGKEKSCDIEGQNCACIAHANPVVYYPPVLTPNPPPGTVPQANPPPGAISPNGAVPQASPPNGTFPQAIPPSDTSPQAIPPPGAIPQASLPPGADFLTSLPPAATPQIDSPPANSKRAQDNASRFTSFDKALVTTSEMEQEILHRRESGCGGERCEGENPVSPPPSECEGEKCKEETPISPPPSECEEKHCEEEKPKNLTEDDYIKMAPHDFIDERFPPPDIELKEFDGTDPRETSPVALDRRGFPEWWQGFNPPPDPLPTDQYKQKPFTDEEKFANRQKKRHEFNDCVKRAGLGQCKIEWKEYESQIANIRTCTTKKGWDICWARYNKMVWECQYHMGADPYWCSTHRYSTAFKRQTVFDAAKTPLPEFMYDKPDDVKQYHIVDKPQDPDADAVYPTKQTDQTMVSADGQASPTSTTDSKPTTQVEQTLTSQSSETSTTSSEELRTLSLVYTFTTLITEAVDAPAPTGDCADYTFSTIYPDPTPTEGRRKRDGNNDESQVDMMDIVIPYPKRPLECNLDPTAPLCQLQKRRDKKYLCLEQGGRWNDNSHSCEGGATSYAPKPARITLATPMPVPTYIPDEADCERRRLSWHGGRCRTEDAGPPPPVVTEVPNNDVGSPAYEACRYQKLPWSDGRCKTEFAGPDTPPLDSMPPFPLPQWTVTMTATATEDDPASIPTHVSRSFMALTTTEDNLASIPTDVSSSSHPTKHEEALDDNQHTLENRQEEEPSCPDGTTFYDGQCVQNDDDIFIDMEGCENDRGVWNIHFKTCEHPTSSERAKLISTPDYTTLPDKYGDGNNIPNNRRDCEAQGYEWNPFYNGNCNVYGYEEDPCDDDDDDDDDDDMAKKQKTKSKKYRSKRDEDLTVTQEENIRHPPEEPKDTGDPARKAPVDPSKQYAYCGDEAPNREDCYSPLGLHCVAWDQWWGCLEWEHPYE